MKEKHKVSEIPSSEQDPVIASSHTELNHICRHMLDAIGHAVIATDVDGVVTYFNKSAEALYGWDAVDAVGKSIMNVTVPQMSNTQAKDIMASLSKGESWSGEFMVERREHTVFPAHVTNTPIIDGSGNLVGIVGISYDITAQKLAEKAQRERNEMYTALFENVSDAIFSYDPDTFEIIDANPATSALYGYEKDELIGMSCLTFSAEVVESKSAVDRIHKEGHVDVFYRHHKKKDGSDIYVQISGHKGLVNGKCVMFAFVKDVTNRKRAEDEIIEAKEASQRNEQLYRQLIDSIPGTSIHLLDKDLRYIFSGGKEIEKNNIDRSFIQGKLLREAFPGDVADLFEPVFRKALAGTPSVFEMEYGPYTYSQQVLPVRNRSGEIFATMQIATNITEHKQMEQTLVKTQKLESLGVLAGGIAHDFNNFLGGIYGYIEMAIDETNNPTVSDYLLKAQKSMTHGRMLTQQLLTFAKGGAPVKRTESLCPFIQETAEFALSGSAAQCHFQIPEDLWPCDIDKNQIAQVIGNLVINAQQAMPNGGTIEVVAQNISVCEKQINTLAAGDYVKVSITDHGIGIPKAYLPNVFDPFYTTKPKGHGLGLATSYSIIDRHMGCIEVQSESGKGSTFDVYLPASSGCASDDATAPEVNFKGSGTFLVMDDEASMREIIGAMLKSFGYTVVLKENGEDALAWFAEEIKCQRAVAGIIFDLTVPGGMGGREAIVEIRKLCTKTPVFVASGYAKDPIISNPRGYGFHASICKPFRKKQLANMIRENLTEKDDQ